MSSDDWLDDEPPKSKSKRKSKGAAHVLDEPLEHTFDDMLESASKAASRAVSSKQKSTRKLMAEAASGWSNDIEDDDEDRDYTNPPPIIQRGTRRAAEEIIATDIPTIPMDEADGDEGIDMTPQIAVAPQFSVNQIASFKEIEKEFSRERSSQYIDSKIDIGILYHHLHLQEEIDVEDQKPWDWDKLFVEVRNAITNPAIES